MINNIAPTSNITVLISLLNGKIKFNIRATKDKKIHPSIDLSFMFSILLSNFIIFQNMSIREEYKI